YFAVDGEEGVLEDLLGVGLVAGEAERERVDLALVAPHQLAERRGLPLAEALDELGIGELTHAVARDGQGASLSADGVAVRVLVLAKPAGRINEERRERPVVRRVQVRGTEADGGWAGVVARGGRVLSCRASSIEPREGGSCRFGPHHAR